MSEKIITAQILALYPNCQCVIVEKSVATGEEIKTPATIEGFDFVLNEVIAERVRWKPSQIKPVLRPLSSMTNEEAKELYMITSNSKSFNGKIVIEVLKDNVGKLFKLFVYKNFSSDELIDVIQIDDGFNVTDDYGNYVSMVQLVDWARRKCFDIDYLIEDGLAYTNNWTCCVDNETEE